MSRQSVIGFLFALLLCIPVYPQSVDLNTARHVSASFVNHNTIENAKLQGQDFAIINSYSRTSAGLPVYYIFELEPRGFVIISAHFGAIPILGYSFESNLDPEKVSPALEGWLDGYASQIVSLSSNYKNQVTRNESWNYYLRNDDHDIPPLKFANGVEPFLRSYWEQGKLYNDSCPEDPDGPGGHCYAGCVAVALAQTLFYYRYPETGNGSITYSSSYNNTIHVDFENTTFKWKEMVNYIHGQANPAIAELVFKAGAAVQTTYGPHGSGSYTFFCRDALVDYFRYDSSVVNYDRIDTLMSWKDTLISNLDKLQPVIYAGGIWSFGRHSFVCDGYQDTSYFHFNFGWWDGSGNGYYHLDDITPFHYDFTSSQTAIFNIVPGADYPGYAPGYDTLTAPMGSFEDGSGHLHYQNNTDSYWLIETDSGSQIMLYFDSFHTSPEDVVTIYDGADTTSPVLNIFSGNENPETTTSSGNTLLIHFNSDDQFTDKGWYAHYTSISNPYCQEWSDHTDTSGYIFDGSGLIYDYTNETDCYWYIHPQGYNADSISGISLFLHEFASETGADQLIIYEGSSTEDPILEIISGLDFPDEIISGTNEMLLSFKSNESGTNTGFLASYRAHFPVYCQDTILISTSAGSIQDGSGQKLYSNNSDCYWLIRPEEADTISLLFTEFDLEYGYDWIEVLDPTTEPPELLRHSTGSQIPQVVQAFNGAMLVHFHSDISVTMAGWEAQFFTGSQSTSENDIIIELSIRPNPADEYLHIDIHCSKDLIMDYALINMTGYQLKKGIQALSPGENTFPIDCRNVPDGIYILRIGIDNSYINRKIIIK